MAMIIVLLAVVFRITGAQGDAHSFDSRDRQPQHSLDPQAIVDRFHPADLDSPADARLGCFAVYDTAPDGLAQTIFAVYPAIHGGRMLVLRRQTGGEYTSMQLATEIDFGSVYCSIDLLDVDGDGRKEIHVSTQAIDPITQDFIFRWDGAKLENIGPVTHDKHGTHSLLEAAWFVDVDGKGELSAISLDDADECRHGPCDAGNTFYRLTKGRYEYSSHGALAQDVFFPEDGTKLRLGEERFSLHLNGDGPYKLHLNWTDLSKEAPVDIPVVLVNGVELSFPRKDVHRGFVAVPLEHAKKGDNTILLKFAGRGRPPSTNVLAEELTPLKE